MEFWTQDPAALAKQLGTDLTQGLPADIRSQRLNESTIKVKTMHPALRIFLGQFKSPILLLLIAAAGLSFALKQPVDGTVVLLIIFGSAFIGFQHEYRADQAVAKLMSLVETHITILQGGKEVQVPSKDVVPGDVVLVSAGSIVPADGVLIEESNLFADEAALTGETFPVEKNIAPTKADTPIAQRFNILYSGSHIASGSGKFLVVQVGTQTQLGGIAKSLTMQRPEADFERGIRHFGMMLVNLTILLTLGVFAINTLQHRSILDSFLFALALAVGLTPQLLPAIVSVNLSRGAVEMAKQKDIVKRLAAIENLGSMNVLCSDKTGTLTLGIVKVHGAFDTTGKEDPEVLKFAQINAIRQAGFRNPIDESLAESAPEEIKVKPELIGEIPYDFIRKRLSVLVQSDEPLLISKGALDPILSTCNTIGNQSVDSVKDSVHKLFQQYSEQGYRVLGVATKTMPKGTTSVKPEDESGMCFRGFIVLEDPLRPEISDTIARLNTLGVELKMITGDNHLVAATLATKMGLKYPEPLTGKDIQAMSDAALTQRVQKAQVFAEIEPNQKARLIIAIKRAGNVVGYIGDGINDGSALHAADAGISVSNAVDVAKEAADFVMLESGLDVLINAVLEGRRTFTNTMKYIFMATSANFGNMFSLAGASMLVPFLPLLPKQVLMMNFLTDIPEMFIASDSVDEVQLQRPQRWDIKFLRRFMIVFGILSSAFDFATFGMLLYFKVPEAIFRTAWFVESVASAALIVLVVRSRQPMLKTRPGPRLLQATIAIVVAVFILPFTPLAPIFGLQALTPVLLGFVILIIVAYITSAEITKHFFYQAKVNK
jgi:Mg2+-importing ATPase